MVSRNTCFSTLVLVSTFLFVSAAVKPWDFAVAIGEEIHFFFPNGTKTDSRKVAGARKLENLAYDHGKGIMFVSDNGNLNNVTIYGINLNEEDSVPYPVLKETNDYEIMAMVFHPTNRMLYWTDSKKKAVMRMQVPLNTNPRTPEKFYSLTGRAVWGITLNICNSFIYWSSCEYQGANSTCRVDGANPDNSATYTFDVPRMQYAYGLAVDPWTKILYWVDDVPGFTYQIWRTNLTDENSTLFYEGEHQHPFYIAVDRKTVYWTDVQAESIWKMENGMIPGNPTSVKSYLYLEHTVRIMSILTQKSTNNKKRNCQYTV